MDIDQPLDIEKIAQAVGKSEEAVCICVEPCSNDLLKVKEESNGRQVKLSETDM